MNKASFVAFAFTGGFVLNIALAPPTYALELTSTTQSVLSATRESVDARVEGIKKEAAEKQAQLQQRLADQKSAVQNKLEGTRAQACQNREAHINEVLTGSVDKAQSRYDSLKNIQTRLETFVVSKQLDIPNVSALETIIDDRQASALAAIEAARAARFSCADTDARTPGKIIMEQISAEKQALKDYRTALKDYVTAIREAITAQSSAEATE